MPKDGVQNFNCILFPISVIILRSFGSLLRIFSVGSFAKQSCLCLFNRCTVLWGLIDLA